MNIFTPQETYSNIFDISLDYLINDIGIKGLIFDFDGTIIRRKKLSSETLDFIKKSKEMGLKVSVLSNNIYVNDEILSKLNITITKKLAFKPLKKPFLDMAKRMKLSPNQIAVIGNNKISDIFGANRAKMYSIFIQNLDSYLFKINIKNKLKNLKIKHIN